MCFIRVLLNVIKNCGNEIKVWDKWETPKQTIFSSICVETCCFVREQNGRRIWCTVKKIGQCIKFLFSLTSVTIHTNTHSHTDTHSHTHAVTISFSVFTKSKEINK